MILIKSYGNEACIAMYRIFFLSLFFLSSQGIVKSTYANSLPAEAEHLAPPAKPLQFYVGLSGGINSMTGRRDEKVTNYPDPAQPVNIFSDNLRFSNKNAFYSAFAGFTWNISKLPLFMGPEIYLGRTNTESERRASVRYEGDGTVRTMQTSIQQSNFAGTSAQIGINFPHQTRSYLSLGIEFSRFHHSTFYIPRSAIAAVGAVEDLLPPSFATTKCLKGFVWGIGAEKAYKNFRFGGDIRFINYKTFKASYTTNNPDPLAPVDVIINSFKPKNIRFSLRFIYDF